MFYLRHLFFICLTDGYGLQLFLQLCFQKHHLTLQLREQRNPESFLQLESNNINLYTVSNTQNLRITKVKVKILLGMNLFCVLCVGSHSLYRLLQDLHLIQGLYEKPTNSAQQQSQLTHDDTHLASPREVRTACLCFSASEIFDFHSSSPSSTLFCKTFNMLSCTHTQKM